MMRAVELGRTGVYNIAGRDIVNRYEFALALARVFGFDQDLITPIKTMQLRQPALRPLKSGLITLKAETELGYKPSSVEQGLLVFKNQFLRGPRRLGDSGPVSAQPTGGRRQAR
jgi:dTDP-4-dehydrorhamnose reductase